MTIKENSVIPTIIVMLASATIGGLFTLGLAFFGAMGAVTLSGPLGWLTLGPIVLAAFSKAFLWVLFGVPLFAMLGCIVAINRTAGADGSAALHMGVQWFDDLHPIAQRVNELASDAGVPLIRYVGWFPSEAINAFAMGTEPANTVIAFSDTAINELSIQELDAVMAHEIAHVANADMNSMTIARGIQEALSFFLVLRGLKTAARWIFTPLGEIAILRLSRQREFAADAIAAELTSPTAIISALKAIQAHPQSYEPAYANISLQGRLGGLFRTHPPLEERMSAVKALSNMPKSVTDHDIQRKEVSDDLVSTTGHAPVDTNIATNNMSLTRLSFEARGALSFGS